MERSGLPLKAPEASGWGNYDAHEQPLEKPCRLSNRLAIMVISTQGFGLADDQSLLMLNRQTGKAPRPRSTDVSSDHGTHSPGIKRAIERQRQDPGCMGSLASPRAQKYCLTSSAALVRRDMRVFQKSSPPFRRSICQ